MKIAVFGRNGQVATELQRRAPEDVTLSIFGRDDVDFSDPVLVRDAAAAVEADAVINAAAYTAVDKAEDEAELAHLVNGASVAQLAQVCAKRVIPLVHISTDYVFPGSGTAPWKPEDATNPLGIYGASKLVGENAIREAAGTHIILRTSWVFSAHGSNFVKTMMRLGTERERLTIVSDQIGGPTPAADIADACLCLAVRLADGANGGTYHFAGYPDVSWADFAREIFAQTQISCDVEDIPSNAYPTAAKRPLNSRLDCSHLETNFGIRRPGWKVGLAKVLDELKTAKAGNHD